MGVLLSVACSRRRCVFTKPRAVVPLLSVSVTPRARSMAGVGAALRKESAGRRGFYAVGATGVGAWLWSKKWTGTIPRRGSRRMQVHWLVRDEHWP